MLAKLIKKDVLRDYKLMITIMIVLVITSIFYKIFRIFIFNDTNNIILKTAAEFSDITYFLVSFGSGVLAVALSVESVNKTMLKDEGYLTHTLPVKTSQILLSKMITSYIWAIAFFIIYIILDLFIYGDEGILYSLEIPNFSQGLSVFWGGSPNNIAGAFFILIIICSPFIFNSALYFAYSLVSALFSKKFLILLVALLLVVIIILYMYFAINRINYIMTLILISP